MKIEQIETISLRIPLKKGYGLSQVYGVLEETTPVVVRIHTDEGIVGLGETDPMSHFTEETQETVQIIIGRYLESVLLGTDPRNIGEIHMRMEHAVKGNFLAKAAIDMACYDLLGKADDMPVYRLLGGCLREKIPLMWSLGDDAPEVNAAEAAELQSQNYSTFMIKVGGCSLKRDVERVGAIRSTVGDRTTLIVDANQGWDADTAIKFAKQTEKYDIAIFEQPVPYWDIDGLAKVKSRTGMLISADESLFTLHDAVNLVRHRAVDVFSIKVSKNGGIYPAREIMSFAAANGIQCLMNSLIEEGITQSASLQLGLTAVNLCNCGHAYFSPLRLAADISNYSDNLRQGYVWKNEAPGLGVELKNDIVEKYSANNCSDAQKV